MNKSKFLKSVLRKIFQSRHPGVKYTRRQPIKGSYTWDITKHDVRILIEEIRKCEGMQ